MSLSASVDWEGGALLLLGGDPAPPNVRMGRSRRGIWGIGVAAMVLRERPFEGERPRCVIGIAYRVFCVSRGSDHHDTVMKSTH